MSEKYIPVRVFEVVEYVESEKESGTHIKQFCYVLATSAREVLEIIGEDETRRITACNEVCAITQLPGDKYRATLIQSQPQNPTPSERR